MDTEPTSPEAPEPATPEAPEPEVASPQVPVHPKRRFSSAVLVLASVLSAALATTTTLVVSRHWSSVGHEEGKAARYQCPMHPTIVQDHPGNCPICGMKLVKMSDGSGNGDAKKEGERKVLFYRSPMDPKQTSPTPRKDEMGMDYLPVYEADVAGPLLVPGFANVDIDAERQQLIGLKTAEVTAGSVGGAWRTVGRLAIDETRVRHVSLKVSGFVERVYVNFIGKKVKRGDPLFSMYSPDLLAAQEEYLLALRTKGILAAAGALGGDKDDVLVKAARRKLSLWDVPDAAIERLTTTGEPTKTLTFYSPVAGVVTKKDVVDGMKLDAGAMPYEIVDLSSVWVLADVYESELRFVKEDMAATLRLSAFPNRDFKGKVVFIDPVLDPQTRTVKVRLTFPNPNGELRPEMFGEVVLLTAPHEALTVPQDAVIDSGTEKLVFVAVREGKFEPRQVKLGETDGSRVEVIRGVARGERVVTRANFLIDSESRLRASLADMSPGPSTPESARVLPGASVVPTPPSHSADVAPGSPPHEHGGH